MKVTVRHIESKETTTQKAGEVKVKFLYKLENEAEGLTIKFESIEPIEYFTLNQDYTITAKTSQKKLDDDY